MYVGGLISFASTNIFICIRHIWIKPVLCSCMVSLFHHTSPWTWMLTVLTLEMEEFSDVRFKQRAVIEFLTVEKIPPSEFHRWMQAIYGDQCVDVSTVRCWVRRFKDGEWGKQFWVTKHEGWISKTNAALAEVYWSAWWFCKKNNYASLKIIDVGIYFFLFLLFH